MSTVPRIAVSPLFYKRSGLNVLSSVEPLKIEILYMFCVRRMVKSPSEGRFARDTNNVDANFGSRERDSGAKTEQAPESESPIHHIRLLVLCDSLLTR